MSACRGQKRATLFRGSFLFVILGLFPPLLAGAEGPAPAPPSSSGAGRSLVLITLDTTRADHLGAWGWPHARTPRLDALARRGVRFAQCDTAAPVTLPSHATILTGLFPPRHGVRDNGTFVLPERIETVAERLAAWGWDTAAVVSAVVLGRRHGLGQGFRLYDDDLGAGYAAGTLVSERQAPATTAAALAAAGKLRPPFFLWVHYFDPHDEYRPPARFSHGGGPHRLYDGEIAFMDEQIGALLDGLKGDPAVVVVGDHGEMLGEHGELRHGLLLYRGARRVPLIVAGPGVPAGRVHDCLVRTADVAPTLLALAGVPAPPAIDGASLLPLPGRPGEGCDRISYAESFLPFFSYKWHPPRALASDRFLYLYGPQSSLYQLATDPGEERDLAAEQPAALRLWEERLRGVAGEELGGAAQPESPLTEEQRRELASLGYLGAAGGGGGGGKVARDLPDPRRMTDVARSLQEAAEAVQRGRCAEALPALQAIVRRDPHNVPALSLTGTCLLAAGRAESALAAFRQASRENERAAGPVAESARCLVALGRKGEAERELRRALTLDPSLPEAAAGLARLLRERGEKAEAGKVLDAAIAAGGHAGVLYRERGRSREEAGRLAEALADFREAARRAPADPAPLEDAARTAYRAGRPREAAQLYEQLLRLAPGRLDLWKTAGAVYLEMGDRPAALRCFRRALTLEPDPAERARLDELVRGLGG